MYEVEVKVKVSDLRLIQTRLEGLGANLLRKGRERDVYYSSPWRDFARTQEVLRVREEDYGVKRYVLTYKGPRSGKEVRAREEIEAQVEEPEKVQEILARLGFQRLREVRKSRTIYGLRNLSISLDDVHELGTFIEVEGKVEAPELRPKAEADIRSLLTSLEISFTEVEPRTYLELLLQVDSIR